MKISFKTLGCRLNQHETDALVSEFYKNGYQIVDFKEKADISIINTCTVTGQSDHKSRNIIQQAIHQNPGAKVVVTGCMAEQYKQELEQIPGISLVVSNKNKNTIFDLIHQKVSKPEPMDHAGVFNYMPVLKSLHTRAAIKIQDGCDNFCSFCIIPQVRGRSVSRPVHEIIEGIKKTIENGFKEIVITGVNIGRYYSEGVRFTGLLEKILEIPGDFRIRISSLEPDGFGPELVRLFKHPKLTPHLHLCLQSGSDAILLKMRRMYSVQQYLDLIEPIRRIFPDFNFTTDIIVGFPGETDQQFKETLHIVKQIGFSHVHTFKYSVRKGTIAERMPEQISESVKNQRSEKIRLLSDVNKMIYYKTFIGKTEHVLVEKSLGDDWYFGYGQHYVPIVFKNEQLLLNQWVDVTITQISGGKRLVLEGTVINSIFEKNPKNYRYEPKFSDIKY